MPGHDQRLPELAPRDLHRGSSPARRAVGSLGDFGVGEWNVVRVDGREIGVYNRGDRLFAVRNRCPHQGARLCVEPLRGTMLPSTPGTYVSGLEHSVIACPWHGWEFDVETGRMLFDTGSARLRCYGVTVEAGCVFIDVQDEDEHATKVGV